jgi:hypothetical protein
MGSDYGLYTCGCIPALYGDEINWLYVDNIAILLGTCDLAASLLMLIIMNKW